MKFKIRFADQIVGFFIVVALASLVVVIFLLGSRQRWFSRDYAYKTYASSASGLSENMPVLLKGMQVGNVKSISLTGADEVEVIFTIYDQYNDRVKEGSLIQILISPIGLGNQFVFHPGLGTKQLDENDLVPTSRSEEGRDLIERGLGFIPSQSDTIAIMMDKANTILDDVITTLDELNLAISGSDASVLGRTFRNVEKTTSGLPSEIAEIEKITRDISVITGELAGPRGVSSMLDGTGTIIADLERSVQSLSGILSDVKQSTAYLPREMPQIINLLTSVRTTLQTAEEVLVALRNNPLLRNGIPEHMETDTSGTNPRDIRF
ncbi:MAG: MlaD family protein [Treponema sp.]|jgi:phospholipid/cholesterol/gamma-HCH transport system substrate-binding protein|nr:MlaD family protein [Treponema sp.]